RNYSPIRRCCDLERSSTSFGSAIGAEGDTPNSETRWAIRYQRASSPTSNSDCCPKAVPRSWEHLGIRTPSNSKRICRDHQILFVEAGEGVPSSFCVPCHQIAHTSEILATSADCRSLAS